MPEAETDKKESLARFERIIREIEAFSFAPETQNNALAYLFYSLVNSANSILNTKTFRERIKDAPFMDLIKGLEILLDQILKLNTLTGSSSGKLEKFKTIQMKEKIKQLEIMRQETVLVSGQ